MAVPTTALGIAVKRAIKREQQRAVHRDKGCLGAPGDDVLLRVREEKPPIALVHELRNNGQAAGPRLLP
ncbi:hypothetical protein TSOC_005120 [Tetrabaena socialis]|uniref:Uncharacterized protein n=1 Tax=Tetrabaena socialis TaxID=47790 RepID=A0A2J8A746_9CHLO|nr:hypothetical protein TSOC_005120 [Tetrabaena socialis]|eukprot:PNH08352.1 hypothetical protein TSOC_005120 [Tetrabaena socialis]